MSSRSVNIGILWVYTTFVKNLTNSIPKCYFQIMKKKIITTSILIFFSFLSFFACFKFAQNLDYTLRTDALNYHTTAINLIQKGYFGYPIFEGSNAYITPFYPLFLALIYKLFGLGNILAVQIIQSLLLIASGILTYFIIKKITDKRIFSIIGAIIYLIYPPFIAGSMQLLTETLYNFCFLLYLFFVIKYLQFPSSGGVPRRGGVVSLQKFNKTALFSLDTNPKVC